MGSQPDGFVVSSALREQLLKLSTTVSRCQGCILFRRGDSCDGIFLVISGKVRLSLDSENHAFPTRLLGSGSVLGLPAAVAGTPYSLSAEVTEDALLAFVPQQSLRECLAQNSQLCLEVMDILSREISATRSAIKEGPRRN